MHGFQILKIINPISVVYSYTMLKLHAVPIENAAPMFLQHHQFLGPIVDTKAKDLVLILLN